MPTDMLVAIDKHPTNTSILRQLHPDLRIIQADLAEPGPWQQELNGCTHLVACHAQIGGKYPAEYVRNNITASERLVEAALRYGVRAISDTTLMLALFIGLIGRSYTTFLAI